MPSFTVIPCPFCGNTDSLEFMSKNNCAAINCNAIRNGCGATSGYTDSFEAAANKWNKRTDIKHAMIASEDAWVIEDEPGERNAPEY